MSRVRPTGRFSATQRLRKRRDFQRVQSSGLRVVSRRFVFLFCPSAESARAPCRLGIVASRRIGNAVVRNRAKRLVREAFRATRELWLAGVDLVVIVRQPLTAVGIGPVVEEWLGVGPQLKRQLTRCRQQAVTAYQASVATGQRTPGACTEGQRQGD